jgi:hypothetical protein
MNFFIFVVKVLIEFFAYFLLYKTFAAAGNEPGPWLRNQGCVIAMPANPKGSFLPSGMWTGGLKQRPRVGTVSTNKNQQS